MRTGTARFWNSSRSSSYHCEHENSILSSAHTSPNFIMLGYYFRFKSSTDTQFLLTFDPLTWRQVRAIVASHTRQTQSRFTVSSGTLRYETVAQAGTRWDRTQPLLAEEDLLPLGSSLVLALRPSTQLPAQHPYACFTEQDAFIEQVIVKPIRPSCFVLTSNALKNVLRAPFFHRSSLRILRGLPSSETEFWDQLRKEFPIVQCGSDPLPDHIWNAIDDLLSAEPVFQVE